MKLFRPYKRKIQRTRLVFHFLNARKLERERERKWRKGGGVGVSGRGEREVVDFTVVSLTDALLTRAREADFSATSEICSMQPTSDCTGFFAA